MKLIAKIASIISACLLLAAGATALDLPTKRVKGKEYYFYKVRKGESLYGISKALGISPDSIVAANPSAADGVRKGDLLLFSVEDYSKAINSEEQTITDDAATPTDSLEVSLKPKNSAIALLLPFGLESSGDDKRHRLMLDFYKGFLIAADSLRERGGMVDIVVRDIEGLKPETIANVMATDTAVAGAAVIIGPDDDAILDSIAAVAARNRSYVFNVLNIRDSSYISNPYMLQGNAPQAKMFAGAVDGLMTAYPGYRPVLLRNRSGRNDKEAFTACLTARYQAEGIDPLIVEYDENLLMADLDRLPCSAGERYVFVPSSGSLQEFNHFAYVLKSYRDKLRALASEALDTAAENGDDAQPVYAVAELFGYPDWTAFRGDALDILHRLNATVYSRFFDDFNSFSSRNINAAFRRWYGAPMTESIPAYGILGFDSGTYLIKNLRANDGAFVPGHPAVFAGVQSCFDFVRAGDGFANEAIYIINFQPDGLVSARVQ